LRCIDRIADFLPHFRGKSAQSFKDDPIHFTGFNVRSILYKYTYIGIIVKAGERHCV
jgi:hypothetical protein